MTMFATSMLIAVSWGCSSSQGLDCSSIKTAHDLSSDRREPGRFLSTICLGNIRYIYTLVGKYRVFSYPLVDQLYCCWVATIKLIIPECISSEKYSIILCFQFEEF